MSHVGRPPALLRYVLTLTLLLASFIHLAAVVAATISVVSFLWLASTSDQLNANLQRVAAVDWLALVLLAVGFLAYGIGRKHRRR